MPKDRLDMLRLELGEMKDDTSCTDGARLISAVIVLADEVALLKAELASVRDTATIAWNRSMGVVEED